MKGTIVKCLEEMIITQHGQEKWHQILEASGLNASTIIWPMADIPDTQVLDIIQSVCKALHITLLQAADAFGEYWVNTYAQKMYPLFFKQNANARDFLLNMDNVHVQMTRTIKNARPPRFEYEWIDQHTLIMHYKSQRGLIDFVVGLIKGVGKYYQEELWVSKLNQKQVQIIFAKSVKP